MHRLGNKKGGTRENPKEGQSHHNPHPKVLKCKKAGEFESLAEQTRAAKANGDQKAMGSTQVLNPKPQKGERRVLNLRGGRRVSSATLYA